MKCVLFEDEELPYCHYSLGPNDLCNIGCESGFCSIDRYYAQDKNGNKLEDSYTVVVCEEGEV